MTQESGQTVRYIKLLAIAPWESASLTRGVLFGSVLRCGWDVGLESAKVVASRKHWSGKDRQGPPMRGICNGMVV